MLIVPAIAFLAATTYYSAFFMDNIELISLLTFSDYVNRAANLVPMIFILVLGVTFFSSNLVERTRAIEGKSENRILLDRFFIWLPYVALISIPIVPMSARSPLILFVVFAFTIGIFWKWVYEFTEQGASRFRINSLYNIYFVSFMVLGNSFISAERDKIRVSEWISEGAACVSEVCVGERRFIDRLEGGFLALGAEDIVLLTEDDQILVSARWETATEQPLICGLDVQWLSGSRLCGHAQIE